MPDQGTHLNRPLLPQELLQEVIKQIWLSNHISALRSCALTSSHFLPTCEKYLFREVKLGDSPFSYQQFVRLREVLSVKPYLSGRVRVLELKNVHDILETSPEAYTPEYTQIYFNLNSRPGDGVNTRPGIPNTVRGARWVGYWMGHASGLGDMLEMFVNLESISLGNDKRAWMWNRMPDDIRQVLESILCRSGMIHADSAAAGHIEGGVGAGGLAGSKIVDVRLHFIADFPLRVLFRPGCRYRLISLSILHCQRRHTHGILGYSGTQSNPNQNLHIEHLVLRCPTLMMVYMVSELEHLMKELPDQVLGMADWRVDKLYVNEPIRPGLESIVEAFMKRNDSGRRESLRGLSHFELSLKRRALMVQSFLSSMSLPPTLMSFACAMHQVAFPGPRPFPIFITLLRNFFATQQPDKGYGLKCFTLYIDFNGWNVVNEPEWMEELEECWMLDEMSVYREHEGQWQELDEMLSEHFPRTDTATLYYKIGKAAQTSGMRMM